MTDPAVLIAGLYATPPSRPLTAQDAPLAERMFPSLVKPVVSAPSEIPRAVPAHVAEWERQVLASPLAPTVKDARAFLHQNATPELLAMLDASGAGSHPAVVELVANLAAKVNAVNPEARTERAHRALYPSLVRRR